MEETNKTKVFSIYVEILAKGSSKKSTVEAVVGELKRTFGSENFNVYETSELSDDEIIEIETGINDDEYSDEEFMPIDDILDEIDGERLERIEDELG